MFQINNFIIIIGVLITCDVSRSGLLYSDCENPDGIHGICRNIFDCKPFFDLLIKIKSRPVPAVISFLEKRHCGFQGKFPIVCCTFQEYKENINQKTNIGNKTSKMNLNIQCGIISSEDRIFGGGPAVRNEFPWMAMIKYRTKKEENFRCGGTLISSRYILTAAHCVTDLGNTIPISIRLGEYNWKESKNCPNKKACPELPEEIRIEKIIIHQNYSRSHLKHDIALIKLFRNVNFTNSIFPICLPKSHQKNTQYEKAIVTGWGETELGFQSPILKKAVLPIFKYSECSKFYQKEIPITEYHMCAGGESGIDSCVGDSGGPLQVVEKSSSGESVYVQIGIVSFGPVRCGVKGKPGVYTKVVHYVDWISENIKT